MPDKIPTYRINEEILRKKLLDYSVPVDSSKCEAIEQEVANLRIAKTITLPEINWKVVAPAALIVLLISLIAFNLETISSWFSPAPKVKTMEQKVSAQPQPKVNTPPSAPSTPSVATETASATNSVVTNTTTNALATPLQKPLNTNTQPVVNAKKTDSVPSETANSKKPNPVMAPPPSDSAAKKTEVNKADTSVQQNSESVKKKRKRRRRSENMDELKESTLQQNSADEDVVVPQ